MEVKRQRRDMISTEELDLLEQRLFSSLNPVQPRTEFVQGLHHRLTKPVTVVLENPTKSYAFLLVGLGLFFGALLLWLLQRLRG